jgi:hypothetical protein
VIGFLAELWEGFTTVIGKSALVSGVLLAIFIGYATCDEHGRDELVIAGHDVAPLTCSVDTPHTTITLATEQWPGWSVKIVDGPSRRGRRAELVTPRHTFALDHANCRKLEIHPFLAGGPYASGTLALACQTPDGTVDAKLDLARCQ